MQRRRYKPIDSPLLNFPAAYVDAIAAFNLLDDSDFERAHELADQLPWDNDCTELRHSRLVHYTHLALWELRDTAPDIQAELARLAAEREQIKDGVQAKWTARHERKVNHYPPASPDFSRAVSYACDAALAE